MLPRFKEQSFVAYTLPYRLFGGGVCFYISETLIIFCKLYGCLICIMIHKWFTYLHLCLVFVKKNNVFVILSKLKRYLLVRSILHCVIKFGCAMLNGGNAFVQRELLQEMQRIQNINCLGNNTSLSIALF